MSRTPLSDRDRPRGWLDEIGWGRGRVTLASVSKDDVAEKVSELVPGSTSE